MILWGGLDNATDFGPMLGMLSQLGPGHPISAALSTIDGLVDFSSMRPTSAAVRDALGMGTDSTSMAYELGGWTAVATGVVAGGAGLARGGLKALKAFSASRFLTGARGALRSGGAWLRDGLRRVTGRLPGNGPGAKAFSAPKAAPKLLEAGKLAKHHLMPQQFGKFFSQRGIDIHKYTVKIGQSTHLKGVHGRGLGNLPGRWNQRWSSWIKSNPNATAKDIYQQLGSMMDEFGLSGIPIQPYK